MYQEEKYYTIEYYHARFFNQEEGMTYEWKELENGFGDPYRFEEAELALAKAEEIAQEGRWGGLIKLRVMKRIVRTEEWYVKELDPVDYYVK